MGDAFSVPFILSCLHAFFQADNRFFFFTCVEGEVRKLFKFNIRRTELPSYNKSCIKLLTFINASRLAPEEE